MGAMDLEDLKQLSILRSQIDSQTVEQIMDEEFKAVSPEDELVDILSIMRNFKLHEVPVVDGGRYLGMVSYGNILKRKNISLETKAKTLMIKVPTVTLETPITQIAEYIIYSNARQLPVVKGNRLIGIVSRSNLIRLVSTIRQFKEIKVWEIMSEVVDYVMPGDDLDDALEIMRRLDVRTIPVVDKDERVIGIIGMREVIDYNYREKNRQTLGELTGTKTPVKLRVESLCVENPITIGWEDDLGTATSLMVKNDISTLPVTDNERLVGIITCYDIIELIAACRERDVVYVQITGLDDDDRYLMPALDKEIAEELTKIAKIYTPQTLTIHVSKYNPDGGTAKYSVSGRLNAGGRVFSAKSVDWDLVRSTEDLMEKLTDMVTETKEQRIEHRKRGSR
ncbi:MAG TPA: CBS domain-containing protein [Candidatus Methanomethylophilaceae archaeon]|nr:CBS domain-containing protein [Candidatus Methanomethylophilaceae archaeon]